MRVLALAVGLVGMAFLWSMQAGASGSLTELSGGGWHTCALASDDFVRCWGLNDDGQLGDGTTESRDTPGFAVPVEDVVQVSAGMTHTCVRTTAGTAACWGENDGRLGNGDDESSATPEAVCANASCETALSGVVSISAGGSHSCAALGSGGVRCWGNNEDGQLGNDSTEDSLTPVAVIGLSNAVEVSLGTSSSCARTSTGAVYCWGSNVEGQIGDGRDCGMRCVIPQQVDELESGAAQIDAAGLHACALTNAGGVMCWGLNFDGQVGDGTENNIRISPVDAIDGDAVAISAGGGFRGHACAVMSNQTLRCWGDNDVGQLGDGTVEDRFVPVELGGINGVINFTAGDAHTCALTYDDRTLCWGSNTFGQFGNGTTDSALWPTVVLLGKLPAPTPTPTSPPTATPTPPTVLPGDANCEDGITSIDAALILQYTAGLLGALECDGDANGNGRVDSIDAALVLQVTAGLLQLG